MVSETPEDRPEERTPEHELPEGVGDQIEEHVRRTRLAGLFLQSPSFMAVTRGEEHVFVNANPAYREMVGDRELIGRSVREAFPELEEQGFIDLLDRVYETGEPYVGSEEPARLRRSAPGEGEERLETVWVSYSYHPLRDLAGDVSGILHHGIDVTERVELRRDLKRR
ncbi:MAG: PAS domain-containing protein, partial [Gemmatimonadota bacterium]